ncbi:PAS domain-containing protein [candidate division KSB1 bacterium]
MDSDKISKLENRIKELEKSEEQRLKAEEKLRESEEKYRVIVENSPNLVAIIQDNRTVYVNKAIVNKSGWSEKEIYSNDFDIFEKLIPERYHDVARRNIELRLKGETVSPYEIPLKKKNGEEFLAIVHGQKIMYKGKQALEFIVIDITEMRETEEALIRTRYSIEQAIDGIFWINSEGNILDVNKQACTLLGYSREELLSMKVFQLGDEFPPEVWKQHWDLLKQKRNLLFEGIHKRKDGTRYPVEINSNFVEFNDVELVCSFARDITERKRSEKILKESEEQFR